MSDKTKKIIKTVVIIIALVAVYFYVKNYVVKPGTSRTSTPVSPTSCLNITLDTIEVDHPYVSATGTVINNCSRSVRYITVWVTCFDSGKSIVARDVEHLFDLVAGNKNYFESPLKSNGGKVMSCTAEITEAKY